MLLILLVIIKFSCSFEVKGSEHSFHWDNHRNVEKHKPLPYIFHPQHFKRVQQVNAHALPPKETVTITKTIVIETTKYLHKQPVCVKAHPRVPYCQSNHKILPTPVLQTPLLKATKIIGVLEKSKEGCHKLHQRREGRHIIQKHIEHPAKIFFRDFVTVTEILRITKVEQYVGSTATLIAENCIPVNEDVPPCPVKVVDYDYPNKPLIEHISIFGKDEIDRKVYEDDYATLFYDESTIFNSSLLF
nr:uncharacterized protein LOC106681810 isoform X2 [Halyomorpha halys]